MIMNSFVNDIFKELRMNHNGHYHNIYSLLRLFLTSDLPKHAVSEGTNNL